MLIFLLGLNISKANDNNNEHTFLNFYENSNSNYLNWNKKEIFIKKTDNLEKYYTEVFENTFPKWLFYQFQLINWYLYNEASGVPSLSASTIYKISINLPSLLEQQKIATFLTGIDEKINGVKERLEATKAYKKGLLQVMFV